MATNQDLKAFAKGKLRPKLVRTLTLSGLEAAWAAAPDVRKRRLVSALKNNQDEMAIRILRNMVQRHLFSTVDAQAAAIAADGSLSLDEMVSLGLLE